MMRISLRSITHRFRKALGKTVDVEAAASEVHVVAPASKGRRMEAFCLPGQLDRVKRTQEDTNMEYELARVSPGEALHAATLAFRLDNAHYVRGVLYAGGMRYPQVYPREKRTPGIMLDEIEECALPSSLIGDRYFGHFAVEDTGRALLGEKYAPVYFAYSSIRGSWLHADRYLQLLRLQHPVIRSARIRSAWIFQDHGMNDDRRNRLDILRSRIRSAPGSRTGHGVFIRRRGGGVARYLANEADLEKRLEQRGFEIVDPASQTADEIVRRVRDAAIICGVEGSALVHGVLSMAADAALVVIQPPFRFSNIWKDYCDALNIKYAYTVGIGDENSFFMPFEEIMSTIDLVS